ncbi:hypothetical protein [Streptomyces sp. H27-S2]|uniref:hypothetical protein n=1 Tax=Streptomyces antarcticus TaxID=2996458 RepID=UPI00226DF61D|nr:hypothetical protein [Streptomyces sp. H27-S2]MCY0955100.1 hypothetical protein [Streptomyces sp. H27-S2]
MTENGRGGAPQPGAPWGPDPAHPARPDGTEGYPQQGQTAPPGQQPPYGPPHPEQPPYGPPHPEQPPYGPPQPGQSAYGTPQPGQSAYGTPQPGQPPYGTPQASEPAYGPPQPGQPAYGYPQPGQDPHGHPAPGYGYPQPGPAGAGHVVGPGYEGPGDPHGYGYPPLPEAVTQYIPPVPAGPGDDATQYIPPVPAGPAPGEAATQYIAPVPAAEFDGLFRGSDDSAGHTQQLPPVREPVREPVRRQQPPRPYPPRGQGPVPHPQQPHPQQPHPQLPHPQQPHHPQQQFAAAPPPPPEAPRKVSPGVIAAVVIGLAVVGLGVGSLLGDGKPKNNDPGAIPAAPSAAGGSAPAGEPRVDPGSPQAVQLDKLLADSSDSREAVIKAVEDIKVCNNLDQAAADLRDAARQREELVTRLKELKVDQLPEHVKLSAALTKAWQSSAAADNSYAAWAQDVGGDKGCKDGKAKSTDNAAAGNKASGDATRSKEQAATLWNTIAAKYSLTKRDRSQL